MTQLLLRLFVPDYDQRQNGKVRSAVGRLSGIVGIVCNALLFGLKLVVGTISGSVSITADAMNNLSDASSAIVTLLGFKLAEKPADEHHPYGHARFEYLSGLAVAGMILVIGVELARSSLEKIFSPAPVEFSLPMALVLVGSVAVKLWMSAFNKRLGAHIGSTTLTAAAVDSRNDAISTSVVLLAAIVEAATSWRIDGFMGLIVALFILYSAIDLGKETISPLLGEGASPELRQRIVDTVTVYPQVLGYHDLMVHDYGPGQRFASIHVEMDQREDPLFCHELIDDMERACLEKHNVHLVIHYDPVVTGDQALEEMKTATTAILCQIDERLSLHDFRMVQGKEHTNLIFDVALPDDLRGREQEIRLTLERKLSQRGQGTFYTVITFDPGTFQG